MPAPFDLAAEAHIDTCGALKDFFYVAGLSSELTTRPVGCTILGVPLALFRDEHGQAHALFDRCQHRGTPLSKGVVIDGKLCCPYHGWMYRGDGACHNIPALGASQKGALVVVDEAPMLACPSAVPTIKRYLVREQHGLVYVCLSDTPKSDPFPIPHHGDSRWTHYFMVTPFDNGITNLVENFMDVPHTVFVHAGWFRNEANKRVPATVERGNGSVVVTYDQQHDKIAGLGFILDPLRQHPMVHTDKYYIPNITRVDYTFGERSGFVITSQCTPIGPTTSKVYTAIAVRLPFDLPGRPVGRTLEPLIHWYTRQVIEQDVAIMRVQSDGLKRSSEPLLCHSTEADVLHLYIESYRRWLLMGATPEDTPPPARCDTTFVI